MINRQIDLSSRVVLITGGTRGIGRAIAIEFACYGAQVFVTSKWGTTDPADLAKQFESAGAQAPTVIEADVKRLDDTKRLLDSIAQQADGIDIFISNVAVAPLVQSLDDYSIRLLFQTIEYSSWPIVEYPKQIHARFGVYPKYVVGISSDGPDHYYPGYDYVSASKTLMEHLARYLSVHLVQYDTKVNVVRFGPVNTDSFHAIFGKEFFQFAKEQGIEDVQLSFEECAKAILALCSGMLDGMNGQVITVDHGLAFRDNLMMRFFHKKSKER